MAYSPLLQGHIDKPWEELNLWESRSFVFLALFLVLCLLITSCTSSGSPPTLESILVVPVNTSIQAGETQQCMAIGAYSDGSTANITGDVTWTSSDSATASIDAVGLARAKAEGDTTITATLDGISGSAPLTVIAPIVLQSISVTPQSAITHVGGTQQYTATGTYSDGSTADITAAVNWTSSDEAVATIDAGGLATALALGETTTTATLEEISGSATLTVVVPVLESISVAPQSALVQVSSTRQYTATGTYSDGSETDITSEVSWESSDEAVATINAEGLATAVAVGEATIEATLEGITGSATLEVTQLTLQSISVTPPDASIEVGQTQQYTATGTYSDDSQRDVTAEVSWTSSDTGVATIDSAGLATAVSAETSTITATLDAVSGSAEITVTAAPPPNIPGWHDLGSDCTSCHSVGGDGVGEPGGTGMPPDHEGGTSDTCQNCHSPS